MVRNHNLLVRSSYERDVLAIAVLVTQLQTDAALYRAGDHLYSLAKTDGDAVLMLDYDSGHLSRLRLNETEWVGGPSVGVDSPISVRVRIESDRLDISMAPERPGTAAPTKIVATRIEPFTMQPLAGGTLYLPRTRGRHPAIVGIPGTGNATRRSMALAAPYFARRGIAVLALDKRADWRSATFEQLADDVIAAVNMLRKRGDIDPRSIGIYASSQGGWIAPVAASRSSSIAFVVCAACPATNLTTQELIRTEAELRADGFKAAEIREAVDYRRLYFDYLENGTHRGELEAADQKDRGARWYPRFGGIISRDAPLARWWQVNTHYVPAESWKQVHVPALLLFGSLDTRVPPAEHAPRIAAADPSATIVIVPNVDHEGFVARTGGRDEVPLLDRLPPRAIEPTIDWILALR